MATSAPKAVPKAVPKVVSPETPMAEASPAKQSRKALFLILGLVLLLGGGAGAWYFMNQNADAKDGSQAKLKPPEPPVFVVLEPFTVNLQADAGEQFLQVAFTLQVADQAEVDLIKLYMPQVRSRVLLMLSSKTASEILTIEGKKNLSTEIAAMVNQPFAPNGKPLNVSNVFFTSFVVQ